VVAVCDRELLGKHFGGFRVSKEFYGEKLVDEEDVIKLMARATVLNVVGEKAIEVAKKAGFISNANVVKVNGIPHAQFVRV